jgi:Leucine-rich repeat (LRR) protein
LRLQGLWLHGNVLTSLPDSIGQLASLQTLSLSGNCLTQLPATIGALSVGPQPVFKHAAAH